MTALIVFAHPEKRSFSGEMLKVAERTLREAGHTVLLSDLYEMGFNPTGGRHDFDTERDAERFDYQDEQKHAHDEQAFAADIRAEHAKLDRADLLLLQFPLWWFTMPAILKGWVDRVFAYGYAYGGKRWYDSGVFSGKRAMVAVTTGGPRTAYGPDGLQGDIDTILFPIQHGILQFVGYEVLQPFVAYSANYSDHEHRAEVLEAYRQRLLKLEEATPLPRVKLADYDEQLLRIRT